MRIAYSIDGKGVLLARNGGTTTELYDSGRLATPHAENASRNSEEVRTRNEILYL